MLLNGIPVSKTVTALKALEKVRLFGYSAFNFTYYSLFSLLLSAILFMCCEYGSEGAMIGNAPETQIACVIFACTGVYVYYENKAMQELGDRLRGTRRRFI